MKPKRFYDYLIYPNGKVYSLKSNRFLKWSINQDGYYRVTFHIHKKIKQFLIHRLIATLFIPNPRNLPEVNHKDMNKNNNDYTNLEWMNHLDNMREARKKKKWSKPIPHKKTGIKCKVGNKKFNSFTDAFKYLGYKSISGPSVQRLIRKGIIVLV